LSAAATVALVTRPADPLDDVCLWITRRWVLDNAFLVPEYDCLLLGFIS